MSSKNVVAEQYKKQYMDLDFERIGLFKLIYHKFHPRQVLYPGCSIHITPAFYFPHVVFVDQDAVASTFFSNRESIIELVSLRRIYKRSPYIQFIAQDFTNPLPIPNNQFDLVLALYTGGVSNTCAPYLKVGGLLVTNNHHNDALDAFQEGNFTLIGVAEKRQDRYRFIDTDPYDKLRRTRRDCRTRQYLSQSHRGYEYIDHESYYFFQRTRRLSMGA